MNFIRNQDFRAGSEASLEGFVCLPQGHNQSKSRVFSRSGGAWSHSVKQQNSIKNSTESLQELSYERKEFIMKRLDEWCSDLGYKDCNVNMLTLSRTLCISKNELSLFFDQCLHSNFRIWLSEVRFNAAKKMMLEYPDYSNDIISAECGFSCRTHLYRIFKTKEGCSPTEWRDSQSINTVQNEP